MVAGIADSPRHHPYHPQIHKWAPAIFPLSLAVNVAIAATSTNQRLQCYRQNYPDHQT